MSATPQEMSAEIARLKKRIEILEQEKKYYMPFLQLSVQARRQFYDHQRAKRPFPTAGTAAGEGKSQVEGGVKEAFERVGVDDGVSVHSGLSVESQEKISVERFTASVEVSVNGTEQSIAEGSAESHGTVTFTADGQTYENYEVKFATAAESRSDIHGGNWMGTDRD